MSAKSQFLRPTSLQVLPTIKQLLLQVIQMQWVKVERDSPRMTCHRPSPGSDVSGFSLMNPFSLLAIQWGKAQNLTQLTEAEYESGSYPSKRCHRAPTKQKREAQLRRCFLLKLGQRSAFNTLDEEGNKTVAQTSDKPGEPDSELIQTTLQITPQLQVKSFASSFP